MGNGGVQVNLHCAAQYPHAVEKLRTFPGGAKEGGDQPVHGLDVGQRIRRLAASQGQLQLC